MAHDRVPVFRAAELAWRDVWRVAHAMPNLLGVAAAIMLVSSILDVSVLRDLLEFPPVALAVAGARAFFLTPLLIAVHRFILIDEITPRYALAPHEPRFLRFFGWSFALAALSISATVVEKLLLLIGLAPIVAPLGTPIILIGGLFLTVRLIILFPAIAVEAPGATASNAFGDTKGYFWNIFIIVAVVTVPLILLLVPMIFLEWPLLGAQSSSKLIEVVDTTITGVIAYPLYVAVASRLFQALAERVMHRAPA